MTAVIGVDVGTTGVKTIAISPEGEVIAKAEQGYPLSTPRPGWSEQDPADWWRAAQVTLGAIGAAGVQDVPGIGLAREISGPGGPGSPHKDPRPGRPGNGPTTGPEASVMR